MANREINVFDKILPEDRHNHHLYIDAVYKANPNIPNVGAEVLSKLLNVKNQGGFRYKGTIKENEENINLIVLYTTNDDIYWTDDFDNELGIFLYYGDNKVAGTDLHETKLHGNEILKFIFSIASCTDFNIRKLIPPILVFRREGSGRDCKFLGLVVPGIDGRPEKEWLTAVWGCDEKGNRFQNYRALFTVLDIGYDSETGEDGINLAWLNDIEKGQAYESKYAPKSWKRYIDNCKFTALKSMPAKTVLNKQEQMPETKNDIEMLNMVHDYFYDIDKGYSFEEFAIDLTYGLDANIIDIVRTRPYRDGGFDGIGIYRLFPKSSHKIDVEFYLEAKCYGADNSVGVKQTSRLISRIKNRQFGILFTTSYVDSQAFQEIITDKHPIVIISGRNIIDILKHQYNVYDCKTLKDFLERKYKY